MNDGAEKFALEYHTADDPDPQGPPFKYRSYYLDDVVAEAFRLQESEGRPLRITRGENVTFDEAALPVVLARVAELRFGDEVRGLRDVATQALAEKAESEEDAVETHEA